jgi:hypothetical protein
MPAVLVECGFMDSSTDVPIILTEEFAVRAAEGLVSALIKMGNLKEKERGNVDKKSTFIDIEGHYAENAIKDLYAMGIISGVDELHYMPEKTLTRGEAAVIGRNIIRYITGK